jgi:hypothetical protein
VAVKLLALRFRAIFLRFNQTITRHSVESSRKGKIIQVEAGPFVEFLDEVLAPLNRFFSELSSEYGAKPISAGYVTRVAKNLDINGIVAIESRSDLTSSSCLITGPESPALACRADRASSRGEDP